MALVMMGRKGRGGVLELEKSSGKFSEGFWGGKGRWMVECGKEEEIKEDMKSTDGENIEEREEREQMKDG